MKCAQFDEVIRDTGASTVLYMAQDYGSDDNETSVAGNCELIRGHWFGAWHSCSTGCAGQGISASTCAPI